MSPKEIDEIGEIPPLGVVSKYMYAQVIRAGRFDQPMKAFKIEKIPVPEPKPTEVLVYVMAAGINFNNVWAASRVPINGIAARQNSGADPSDFHLGGSDASGVRWAVGSNVKNVNVGDHVAIHCGQWDPDCPAVKRGEDPVSDPSFVTPAAWWSSALARPDTTPWWTSGICGCGKNGSKGRTLPTMSSRMRSTSS